MLVRSVVGSVQARIQKRHEAYLHGQRPVRGLFSPPDSPLPAGLTLHCRSPYTQSYTVCNTLYVPFIMFPLLLITAGK